MRVLSHANRVAEERRLERLRQMVAAWRVEFLVLDGRQADAKREADAGGVLAAAERRGPPDFGWRVRLAPAPAGGPLWAAAGPARQDPPLVDAAPARVSGAKTLLPPRRLDALRLLDLQLS